MRRKNLQLWTERRRARALVASLGREPNGVPVTRDSAGGGRSADLGAERDSRQMANSHLRPIPQRYALHRFVSTAWLWLVAAVVGSCSMGDARPPVEVSPERNVVEIVCSARRDSICTPETLAPVVHAALEQTGGARLWMLTGELVTAVAQTQPLQLPRRGGPRSKSAARDKWIRVQVEAMAAAAGANVPRVPGFEQHLVEAIGTAAAAGGAAVPRQIWVIADGREVSGPRYHMDMDCASPKPQKFAAVATANAFANHVLDGVTVQFVAQAQVRPPKRPGCRWSVSKVNKIRNSWNEAISASGGSVRFWSDVPAKTIAE